MKTKRNQHVLNGRNNGLFIINDKDRARIEQLKKLKEQGKQRTMLTICDPYKK